MTVALPQVLRLAVADRLEQLQPLLGRRSGEMHTALPRVLAASRFVGDVLCRQPDVALQVSRQAEPAGAILRRLRALDLQAADFSARLRRLRNAEMARIAFRDLAGWARVEETLGEVSELAESCCQLALDAAQRRLAERHGMPQSNAGTTVHPYLLGMGKLGGGELNFSSDIDLICGFTDSGLTAGPSPIANEEYFEKLVRELSRDLGARTADGFVFRVDWMLRPFGASGPPAMASAAIEQYYQVHGREWERYALIKARAVAGDRAAGELLLRALQPFVYRRYLDFNAIGALRELKRLIDAEVARKELHDDLKLGPGGIREIEFIVQAFQLMRGGRDPQLRSPQLRTVLRRIGEAGLLDPEVARQLQSDYDFLRRAENALQMYQDEQTHRLPSTPEAQAALHVALDFPDWGAFERTLAAVRGRVQAQFEKLFAGGARRAASTPIAAAVAALWTGTPPGEGAARLGELGLVPDAGGLAEDIASLRQSRLARTLSESSLAALESVIALLLEAALGHGRPGDTARRTLQVVAAVAGRSTYVALLRESATARTQLLRLCAASPWITEFLARSPVLLDQLLDERTLYAAPDREQMRAELDLQMAQVAAGDTEGAMNTLRRFRHEVMLRIAAADVVQALPLVKVSDRLTWLAEVIVHKALALIEEELAQQHGRPLRRDGEAAGFAVIAYGKFAGLEMGYGSDLDIVFLHDCDALDAETAGPRPLVAEVWLSRLAQRLIHWLSTQTALGRVYEVDLELRPDGRRGLTVSSLASFAQYQRTQAWTWEHQALTRARGIAGSPRVCAAFEQVRRDVLTQVRDARRLAQDVRAMRERMRAHLDKSGGGRFDVKQGGGGLTDIEFLTQFLVLAHAHRHAGLVEWPDNWRQTDALVAAGVLPESEARVLIETYRAYRAWLHARDLQRQDHLAEDSRFERERRAVRELWRQRLEAQAAAAAPSQPPESARP